MIGTTIDIFDRGMKARTGFCAQKPNKHPYAELLTLPPQGVEYGIVGSDSQDSLTTNLLPESRL